jgi:predicted cupin superfamily sugar epimerase
MGKEQIIARLGLEPHPLEGGYFRRTYESDLYLTTSGRRRRILSSIYYMLTSDSPVGYLHRNRSDIIHYFHSGSSIRYLIVSPDGEAEEKTLGCDIAKGELPQLLVQGGYWKASRLGSGEYGLISEAVTPGFEYEDNELATLDGIDRSFPDLVVYLDDYIKR